MPKTVSIAPSWYWPAGTPRFCGIPPFGIDKMVLGRLLRRGDVGAVVIRDENTEISASELAALAQAARRLTRESTSPRRDGDGAEPMAVLYGEACAESAALLVAALASGIPVMPRDEAQPGRPSVLKVGESSIEAATAVRESRERKGQTSPIVSALDGGSEAGTPFAGGTPTPATPTAPISEEPALVHGAPDDASQASGLPVHSQGSLLAQAVSLSLFYRPVMTGGCTVALPMNSWMWPAAVLASLYESGSVTVNREEGIAALTRRPGPSTLVTSFEWLGRVAKDAKRELKGLRGSVSAVLAAVSGPFDPSDRKRAEKLLDCPVLTVFGSRAAGPVLGSHPSWYLAESVGIPLTNADVVPVDPHTKQPLATLWELVEYADITVRSPMVAPYQHTPPTGGFRRVPQQLDTGVLGSSDPNGMIYLISA